ncbi:MAG: haloalkane dehalogenase [Cellvibrionaceae bacterium]|nr:haloalkane dehalogenase [Cellvibrionaceae bacterium]|tara:strand:- start:38796 stop:39803 length:1008 start_codon:yes stop_codon:yes gene_type:complete
MKKLRTPDACFNNLPDYDFPPHYTDVYDGEGGTLRMHHIEQGPTDGEVVLCLHGQPTWSFLYRKVIPVLAKAGYRVIAPDLVGFGKSDKPTLRSDYTYSRHVNWLKQWLVNNNLNNVNLLCGDWGGLIGLRLAAAYPDRFARLIPTSTVLPDSEGGVPLEMTEQMYQAYESLPVPVDIRQVWAQFESPGEIHPFLYWRKLCSENKAFRPSHLVEASSVNPIAAQAILDAYNAPFPNESYLAGVRQFPSLLPVMPDDPELATCDMVWRLLRTFSKPVMTVFGDKDAFTIGAEKVFQERIPGANGQPHTMINNVSHFAEEEAGEELAQAVVHFLKQS